MKNAAIALFLLVLLTSCCKDKGIYRVETIGSLVGSNINQSFREDTTSNFQDAAIIIFPEKDKVIEEGKNCSIYGGTTTNVSKLSSIEITSEKEIKSDGFLYAKGVSLNSLFKVLTYNEEVTIDYFNLSLSAVEFSNNGSVDPTLILKLANKPDEVINQKFTIILTFEDGAVFEVESPIFKVAN